MYAYTYQYGCRIRGKWKNPVCSYHRSSRTAAASRMWKKKRSHYGRSPWNFQFNPICGWHQHEEAMSSVNCLHHYGVEGTTACQESSWIHSIQVPHQQYRLCHQQLIPDRMKKGMEELRPDWQIDQSIQSRAQFSNIKQELKAVSTATTSTKYYQVFTQVFPKPATV